MLPFAHCVSCNRLTCVIDPFAVYSPVHCITVTTPLALPYPHHPHQGRPDMTCRVYELVCVSNKAIVWHATRPPI